MPPSDLFVTGLRLRQLFGPRSRYPLAHRKDTPGCRPAAAGAPRRNGISNGPVTRADDSCPPFPLSQSGPLSGRADVADGENLPAILRDDLLPSTSGRSARPRILFNAGLSKNSSQTFLPSRHLGRRIGCLWGSPARSSYSRWADAALPRRSRNDRIRAIRQTSVAHLFISSTDTRTSRRRVLLSPCRSQEVPFPGMVRGPCRLDSYRLGDRRIVNCFLPPRVHITRRSDGDLLSHPELRSLAAAGASSRGGTVVSSQTE